MSLIWALVLALLICAIATFGFMLQKPIAANEEHVEKERQNRLINRKSTYFLDMNTIDAKCSICFGEIGKEQVSACSCGEVFHTSCAQLTGDCPYCKRSVFEMTVRESKRPRCPKCGRTLDGNICTCGTILPNKDGTFKCTCGEMLSVRDNSCPSCGTTFSSRFGEMN